jgi:hypothetical protein
MPKVNFEVRRLWKELRALITPIDAEETTMLLNTLKTWIESNQKLLQQELDRSEALSLLLEGKATEFPMNKPQAGQNLKRLITSDLLIPSSLQNIVDTLETGIREFAVFTKWEDCPVCQEGYLGYWINVEKNKIVLHCPECGWEDVQDNERTGTAKILPASIQQLREHGIMEEHR